MTLTSRGSQERRNAMVEYLKQMSEIVSESTDPEQSSQALAAIVTEIKGKESLIATDQKLSKVLEKLIDSNGATLAVVKAIFTQLNSCVLDLVYDQYGSHVFETILRAAAKVEADAELVGIVATFTDSISSDLFNLMADCRATFVVRTALQILGGFALGPGEYMEEISKAVSSNETFSASFEQLLEASSSFDFETLECLAAFPHSSLTYQSAMILASKSRPALAGNMVKCVLTSSSGRIDSLRVISFLDHSIKAKLMETAVSVTNQVDSTLSGRIIDELVGGNVLCSVDGSEDVVSPSDFFRAKFAFGFLQAFISSLSDGKTLAKFVARWMTPAGMRDIVQNGKGHGLGLIQKTAETLIRMIESQTVFFANLCEAIHVEKDNVWMAVLSMNIASFAPDHLGVEAAIDESKFTPQGCLMMSTLLQFKISSVQPVVSHTKGLMEHLKSIDIESTRFLADMGPGRMLQTLMSADSCVPSGMRSKIIRLFLLTDDASVRLTKLAADRRVGSWLITTAWDSCDLATKQSLGDALLTVEQLRDINWKVWKHCNLATFSRRNDEWTQSETRKSKAHGYMKDIIGEGFRPNKHSRY